MTLQDILVGQSRIQHTFNGKSLLQALPIFETSNGMLAQLSVQLTNTSNALFLSIIEEFLSMTLSALLSGNLALRLQEVTMLLLLDLIEALQRIRSLQYMPLANFLDAVNDVRVK